MGGQFNEQSLGYISSGVKQRTIPVKKKEKKKICLAKTTEQLHIVKNITVSRDSTPLEHVVSTDWEWIFHSISRFSWDWASHLLSLSFWLACSVKDGWVQSKYCSEFSSSLHRWFGRMTRQTGTGIKPQPLFHGGLTVSLSQDCTWIWLHVSRVQPNRLIYQSNDRSVFTRYYSGELVKGKQIIDNHRSHNLAEAVGIETIFQLTFRIVHVGLIFYRK